MSSVAVRRMPAPMSGMILIAAIAMPWVGFAQTSLTPDQQERERRILEQIREVETRDGVNSPDLIDPWMALGLFHEEQDRHHMAATAFQRARHVVRVNYGLSSLREVPVLMQLVRTEEARGNAERAWDLERELLALARQHAGDMQTYPVFAEVARKRLDLLDRYDSGKRPPQIELGCYYAGYGGRDELNAFQRGVGSGSCTAGSRRTVIMTLIRELRGYQAMAVEALVENGRYAGDELERIAEEVVRTNHEYGAPFAGIVFRPILRYVPEDSAETRQYAQMLIHRADISVLRAHRVGRAHDYDEVLELYEAAHGLLEREGVDAATLDEIFSPAVPVVLPSIESNPLISSADSASGASGDYIEVAFDVTKYGEAGNVERIDTSGTARGADKDLVRTIKRGAFRPRLVGGEIVDADRVVLRHYVSD